MRKIFRSCIWCAVWGIVLSACTCSTETAIQNVLGARSEAPVFIACKAVSATEITFQFSRSVRVSSLYFDPPVAVGSVSAGDLVSITLTGAMETGRTLIGGERIVADMVVEDEHGNTLNVVVPFRTRNDNVPPLLMTELRTEYSKPKVEYVELKTLGAGNMGALRLFIASNGLETPVFEFPPAAVGKDEYILVHLRTLDQENSVDETGADLAASPYSKDYESFTDVRDFWAPEAKKRVQKKGDAIILMDQDDRVIDAVLISEAADSWWNTENLTRAAELLGKQGAWLSAGGAAVPGPGDAASSRNATATRTICRDETVPDSNSAADWYITVSSGNTPGKANNVKRFQPKE
ncbi:hypothetical protein FACS189444_5720 [Spirochaetia bacterium]|nr:hypothetical protein FACS189444_5720 [Spirochaetia bacterium]